MKQLSFKELASFALNWLITPISNAVVERVFSLLTCVKTKSRNKMQLALLEAIIPIKTQFMLSKKWCKDFVPSEVMIQNFKSEIVYASVYSISHSEDDILSYEEMFMQCTY